MLFWGTTDPSSSCTQQTEDGVSIFSCCSIYITSFGFPVAAASRQLCSLPPTPPPTQRQRYHRRKRPLCQTYQRGGVLVNHPLRTLTYRTPSLTSVSVHHQNPLSVATQQRRQQWSHTILPPTHPPHQQQHWHVNPFEYLD